ncbi:MAG: ADP-ribosyl-(dinitrogen reductase) glycohydrolase [Pelotomaculum sp. PtaB.Bin104]|nr:MAG: ADP-ribosyl-(dinitrogen reductase) glycohydrolase [Pelotomaculum sp. PtaB.Bin104]
MYDKILGGLLGAAVGDAMGAATEARTTEQIIQIFGHEVTDFEKPPADAIGAGNERGQLTDDFSCAYFIASHIIRHNGLVNQEIVKEAIIDWSEHKVFFERFAGPTTRLAIKKFKGETTKGADTIEVLPWQATNGAGMRISPIGLLNPGNLGSAINDAVTATLTTHDNHLAISGACAVACAVSRAMLPDADVYQVVQAGLYGAKEGERIGQQVGKIAAGPSVVRRMEMAVRIGLGQGTPREKMFEIADRVGSGLHISEAVPAAFGLFIANGGDAMASIIGGVNIGYDTDTVATMTGAIAGTLQGAGAFPNHYLELLDQVNGIDLANLARGIEKIAKQRRSANGRG